MKHDGYFLLQGVFCETMCCHKKKTAAEECRSCFSWLCSLFFSGLTTASATAAGKFFWFLLYMMETLLYFTYYGVMCVAVTPNLLAAAVASNSLYLTMNLFSGFVIPAPVSLLFFFTY